MKMIDCKAIAAKILMPETTKKLRGKTIVAVVKELNDANRSYLKSISRVAKKYGVEVLEKRCRAPHLTPYLLDDLLGVYSLKPSEKVLFVGFTPSEVIELVDGSKVIDSWLQVLDMPTAPDVVHAVHLILQEALGDNYRGPHNTVIIGRSELAIKAGFMLLHQGHTVTFCHTGTGDLWRHCHDADVIVSFAGSPGLITARWLTGCTTIVSVGCSVVDGKVCGDIDLEGLDHVDGFGSIKVTPTPGGVGVVTTALLFESLAD